MTTENPEPQSRSRAGEILLLVLAAVAAVVIAFAAQGRPEGPPLCPRTSCEDA